jgi:hypothetical protein
MSQFERDNDFGMDVGPLNYWCVSCNPAHRMESEHFAELELGVKHDFIALQPWKTSVKPKHAIPYDESKYAAVGVGIDIRAQLAQYGLLYTMQGQVGDCTCATECEDAFIMDILGGKATIGGIYSIPFAYAVVRMYEGQSPPLRDTGAVPIDIGICFSSKGICFDALWPNNNGSYNTTIAPTQAMYQAALQRIGGTQSPVNWTGPSDWTQPIADGIAAQGKKGLLRVAFPVPSSFFLVTSNGGDIPIPQELEPLEGGHEMEVIGHDPTHKNLDGTGGAYQLLSSWGNVGDNKQKVAIFWMPYSWPGCEWVMNHGSTIGNCYQQNNGIGPPGPSPPSNTYTHTYTVPDTYIAEVDVTDSKGIVGKATIQITVNPPPGGLTVTISADQTSGQAPLTVNFSASVANGTSPYQYVWTPGDQGKRL